MKSYLSFITDFQTSLDVKIMFDHPRLKLVTPKAHPEKKIKSIWYEHSNNPKQHAIYVSQTQTGGMSFRLWGGIPLTLSQSCSALFLHCYTCDARLPYVSSTILYITCHQTPRSFFSLSRFQRSKLVMRNPEK